MLACKNYDKEEAVGENRTTVSKLLALVIYTSLK